MSTGWYERLQMGSWYVSPYRKTAADIFDRFYMAELALGWAITLSPEDTRVWGASICGANVKLHYMEITFDQQKM